MLDEDIHECMSVLTDLCQLSDDNRLVITY